MLQAAGGRTGQVDEQEVGQSAEHVGEAVVARSFPFFTTPVAASAMVGFGPDAAALAAALSPARISIQIGNISGGSAGGNELALPS